MIKIAIAAALAALIVCDVTILPAGRAGETIERPRGHKGDRLPIRPTGTGCSDVVWQHHHGRLRRWPPAAEQSGAGRPPCADRCNRPHAGRQSRSFVRDLENRSVIRRGRHVTHESSPPPPPSSAHCSPAPPPVQSPSAMHHGSAAAARPSSKSCRIAETPKSSTRPGGYRRTFAGKSSAIRPAKHREPS